MVLIAKRGQRRFGVFRFTGQKGRLAGPEQRLTGITALGICLEYGGKSGLCLAEIAKLQKCFAKKVGRFHFLRRARILAEVPLEFFGRKLPTVCRVMARRYSKLVIACVGKGHCVQPLHQHNCDNTLQDSARCKNGKRGRECSAPLAGSSLVAAVAAEFQIAHHVEMVVVDVDHFLGFGIM